MRYMKPVSRPIAVTYGVVLGMVAVLGVVPWAVVPVQTFAAEKAEPKKETVDQKDKNGWGKFVSFKDGTLTLESNAGVLIVWNKIAESSKTLKFDPDTGKHKPVESTADALNQVKAGTWVAVMNAKATIYIGAGKGQVTGTFVSFKNDRLLMLGKNLGEAFTKKYGNNMQFNKIRDDVPVHESIDGGEYKLIGTANKVLGDIKEGAILTVHSEGDDNITLIQIGVPKTK
ncbi:MAG: hypothetical protein AABP62_29345 [Planctomycetota bacterium]